MYLNLFACFLIILSLAPTQCSYKYDGTIDLLLNVSTMPKIRFGFTSMVSNFNWNGEGSGV